MTIRPVGVELFHLDGQKDRHMTKQIVAFHNFAYVPKSDRYLRIVAWDQKKKNNSIMAVNMLRMNLSLSVRACVRAREREREREIPHQIVVDVCIDTLNKCVYEWVLEVQ
jgi:hypothetical protein